MRKKSESVFEKIELPLVPRSPAQFEPIGTVILRWPYEKDVEIKGTYEQIIKAINSEAQTIIIVEDDLVRQDVENRLSRLDLDSSKVSYFVTPTDRAWLEGLWTRDYGPFSVICGDGSLAWIGFLYDPVAAWPFGRLKRALRGSHNYDGKISTKLAQHLSIPIYRIPLYHDGGNFMTDGRRTGFACSLLYERNANLSHEDIDQLLCKALGLEKLIVMKRLPVELAGHLDVFCKLLNPETMIVAEADKSDPNHQQLEDNYRLLEQATSANGKNYRIVRIPCLKAVNKYRLKPEAPGYTNSLIVNKKVLVPEYGTELDREAWHVYEELMPDHKVIPIDCRVMGTHGGQIHCITRDIPDVIRITRAS